VICNMRLAKEFEPPLPPNFARRRNPNPQLTYY
jgi:hypothetical protein